MASVAHTPRTWTPRLVLSAVALSAFVHLPGLLRARPLDDETYLASMGKMLRAGDVLYRDVIDRKPPLVLWIYELLVPSNWDLRPLRVVAMLLIAINGLFVLAIARRLGIGDTGARVAGAFAIVGSALAGFSDAHAANFEIWGLAAASVAVWLALEVGRPPASNLARLLGRALASGAMVAVATNCKQPYIFTLIVVAFTVSRAHRVIAISAVVVGFATVTAAIAAAAGWSGYWKWVWFDNGDYIQMGFATLATLAIRQCVVFVLVQWPLSLSAFRLMRLRAAPGESAMSVIGPARRLGLIWFGAGFIGVASGLRFFGHYFQQCVPPLALLAGLALDADPHTARRRLRIAVGFAPALWLLTWIPGLSGLDAAPRPLAQGIAARTTANDRVLVWGRLPDAAVQAHRTPIGRFVHQAYLTGRWASVDGVQDPTHTEPYATRWRDYLAGLVESPPTIIVDASKIVDGWHQYSIDRLPLQRLVDACYRNSEKINNLDTYEWTGVSCARAIEPAQGL